MNHIQNILTSAINRIKQGSDVSNITEVEPGVYTFETADLKNIRVGLDIVINSLRYTVTEFNTSTKVVTVSGFELPDGATWELVLNFRFGSRKEINELLNADSKVDSNIFPFIWQLLNYTQTPLPEYGAGAYETEIKIFFVNSCESQIYANDRLNQNFELVFDNLTDLFFTELNTLPTAENFIFDTSAPINGKLTDRYFFGSQENNLNVFSVNQTDAREYDIELKVVPISNNICVSGLMPPLIPTFNYVDNSDVEAFTGELFTAKIALNNTTVDTRPVPYSITFDWGVLGIETFTGMLQFGESVNLVSAKVLTDIKGAFNITISGSASATISNIVQFYSTVSQFYLTAGYLAPVQFGFTGGGTLKTRFVGSLTDILFSDLVIKSINIPAYFSNFEVLNPYLVTRIVMDSGMVRQAYLLDFVNLVYFDASFNSLNNPNTVLSNLVTNGKTNGHCKISGGGNAAPTGQGLIDKATLQSRGWTVITK